MTYESEVEPTKLGYLFDFRLSPGYPQEMRNRVQERVDQPARRLDPDGVDSHLVGRFGQD